MNIPEQYVKKILTSHVYDVAIETPLQDAASMSARLGHEVALKREDLQRSSRSSCAGHTTRWCSSRPRTQVIGVEAEGSACLAAALRADRRVRLPFDSLDLFADGVSVAQVGREPFRIAKTCVDGVITVSVDEICAAIKDVFDDTRSIAEPAGALAVAASRSTPRGAHPIVRGVTSPSSAAQTSTSTACGTSPSAPSWASIGRRSSASPLTKRAAAFAVSAAASESVR